MITATARPARRCASFRVSSLSEPEILTIRTPSGISGDMLVAGLALMAQADRQALDAMVASLNLPDFSGSVLIEPVEVEGISGWRAQVSLPDSHDHRSYADIRKIIRASSLTPRAREYAGGTFRILAEAEGVVHSMPPEEVTFHEVGALDSILDICLSAGLVDLLAPDAIRCSPLPLCDGEVQSAHGLLTSPAPAVQHLLRDIPVYGIDSWGETVTPTALAILKALKTEFGLWPEMTVKRTARVYGSRVLPNVPNGAIFALGALNVGEKFTPESQPQ
ncbi:MAG: LarC family nickel insertion protein [Fidelibacterota bacterium]|nr:MAG: LarC family nickel insertion protein [Candidatus Neomarinimicrobiota bacterium]